MESKTVGKNDRKLGILVDALEKKRRLLNDNRQKVSESAKSNPYLADVLAEYEMIHAASVQGENELLAAMQMLQKHINEDEHVSKFDSDEIRKEIATIKKSLQ